MSDLQRIEALDHHLTALHAAVDASLTKARDDLDALRESITPRHEPVAAPVPVVNVGDRIKVHRLTRYREVIALDGVDPVIDASGFDSVIERDRVLDVYSAEEFAANSSLLQMEVHDAGWIINDFYEEHPNHEGSIYADGQHGANGFAFLSAEATAALGPFEPVPDRSIVAGDCVRNADGEVWSHKPGFWVGADASLVASEDAAFIPPPAEHRGCKFCDGSGPLDRDCDCDCHTRDDAEPDRVMEADSNSDDEPAYICPVQGCGQAWQHEHATAGGYYLPAEPITDDRPIPESWKLITAGDGAIWHSSGFGKDRHWRPVDFLAPAIWITDAEILELGPVREAVVVTLPEGSRQLIELWSSPDHAKRAAADLLAAARQAERAGGAS